MSARNLVIVESPAKAKTIGKYLGDDFTVAASVGHIRDLPLPKELPADMKKGPYGRFAVNVEEGFEPYYVVNPDKKKTVSELKKLLKEADALYLATDEDREGEAIAWHLLEALKPKKSLPVYRMVFHEITKEAIQKALTETRELDMPLVDAQETRRILDRLVGYELSPVLWRKVRRGTSAGRVQSVATRLVVDRERERMAFKAASYWDVTGEFITSELSDRSADTPAFTAQLRTLDGQRVATGRDFTDAGELKKSLRANVTVLTEESARLLIEALDGAKATVGNLESKPYTRRPAAPFTTSSLQQEASRKLRMGARHTMSTAQRLYENGYITYMRTDSVVLSGEAIRASRAQIQEMYGAEYVPDRPRVYTNKSQGAQEAHEAIRPAGSNFRTPAQVSRQLSGDEFRLYELIWKRTVASQMADAKGTTTSVTLDVEGKGRTAQFGASGTIITFRGFLAAYEEGRDQSRYAEHDDKDKRLPQMKEGQQLTAAEYTPNGHETTPPPRYTEASLVRALEERGIGRPSTYAATISVIQDRGYVEKKGSALVPSWLAFSVVKLLEEHFGTLVDYEFTADMEAGLDRIAAGNTDRVHWLSDFYFGKSGSFDTPAEGGLKATLDNLGDIDARAINTVPIGNGIDLRMGQYGPYIERAVEGSDTPQRANVPADLAPDELTLEKAEELMARAKDDGRVLGRDPDSGFEILAKDGRYGPYVTENLELDEATKALPKTKQPKPRTASLFKDMDLATVTLEDALKLLSLPRVVGKDAEGVEITAQNGRYGPYLKKGTDSRSLETEAQLFTITEEEALALYAQPKRRGRAAAKPPIAELGVDPTSEKPIVIKDGRFGMYITDGTTNVTLRKDESPETMTHERAVERLAEKRAKGPAKRKTTRKSSSRAKSTKK
ncbi:type I DNA topoisomerase [Dermabacter hominis]|uniref:type I DNA topoisomerase n=1 Tax=Dermabacter hominis TaxID=36740 RepID=UPI0021A8AD33|nr:type I DNA topoisomerase [Dermabacter hominis]MCT2055073.1 type I DNA topoisomerase [Dermabacter hominis]MCT2083270.1 type I DNA topoisomerase [Dermabacter hominis]MCT2091335.1 type I DNA topoisomerase [Dermabacter hominis]MCT2189553.1 type I DNA topoisomerase [Dermabacter hominis]MCT2226237.1 type I DNA topoisomerase [Dermabacter hominis]